MQTNYVGLATGTATIKGSPATLLTAYAVNRNAAVRYLQLFDSTAAASGTPTYQFYLPAGSATAIPLPVGGQSFVTGLTFGFSTAAGTYTAATAADHDLEVVYQ